MANIYDIVIIGSGLGGLECALMLSKEGYNVCVLEQSSLFGGCLQSFTRNGRTIDTGMHYIGSMNDGEIMHQYFKYFGILDELDYIMLNDRFDVINFGGNEYYYHTGSEGFMSSLVEQFPHERNGIEKYCNQIFQIGQSISVDTHRTGHFSIGNLDSLSISVSQFINECVQDTTLQSLLAATNSLYAGVKNQSNLYHHSMINYSNIQGACRFTGGTQHVADSFVNSIRKQGGTVLNNSKVISINMCATGVSSVTLKSGEVIFAKQFISNIHPASTFDLVEATPFIKKSYKSRFRMLPNTHGIFSVYLLMKENSFPYINSNLYYYKDDNVWDVVLDDSLQAKAVLLSSQLCNATSSTSNVLTLMSLIEYSLFEKWKSLPVMKRGDDYNDLKSRISDNIINFVAQYLPNLIDSIDRVYSSSPLTYENYTGTPQGSAYGILKGYNNALVTLLPAKTKIPNLYLTGQNLNVHGALGVTLSSAITCSEFLGAEYLAKKIGNV